MHKESKDEINGAIVGLVSSAVGDGTKVL